MVNWNYLRKNYPEVVKAYMRKSWSIEQFWESYGIYANCILTEEKTGLELWDFKIESKLVIYTSLCCKSIMKDGKKISVFSFDKIMERKINQIFELIEQQMKNQKYLNN
jgi:uncharacterized protein (DUF2344 family)